MEASLKTSVIGLDEIKAYESALNTHLLSVFGDSTRFAINDEFVGAAIIEDKNKVVASGFAYSRKMKQCKTNFSAAIIGPVSVDLEYRGQGLSKIVMQSNMLEAFQFGQACQAGKSVAPIPD